MTNCCYLDDLKSLLRVRAARVSIVTTTLTAFSILFSEVALPTASGQNVEKTWIFFTDKLSSTGKAAPVEPGYISDDAVERRRRRGSNFSPLADVPISPDYLDVLASLGVEVVHHSRWLNAVSARMNADLRRTVRNLPFVRKLQRVGMLTVDVAEPIPLPVPVAHPVSRSINCGPSCGQLRIINAEIPLDSLINGQGVKIGFVDTRFEYNDIPLGHPATAHLANANRVRHRDFTADDPGVTGRQSNFHGVNVTSVALGNAANRLIGPCHGADSVYVAETEWAPLERNVEEDNFVAAVEWMEAGGVDVINCSLSYGRFDSGEHSYTQSDMDGDTGVTTIAFDMAAERGVVPVAAAGNSRESSSWPVISTPADGDSVIAIGSIDPDSTLSSFSSTGPTADGRTKPDVVAQGRSVYIASSRGGYGLSIGTSFSSPMVAGVVCQILQVNPNLNPYQVWEVLTSTADKSSSPDSLYGWGIVNAWDAIKKAEIMATSVRDAPELPYALKVRAPYPNPFVDKTTLEVEISRPVSSVSASVYNVLGQRVFLEHVAPRPVGTHSITIDGQHLPSGLYTFVVTAGGQSRTGLMVHIQ